MRIADGVEMIVLSMNMGGEKRNFYPTLIWDDENVILVDTGLPGGLDGIQEEMSKAGVSFDKLNKIIITHQDVDHIGGLPDILRANNKIEVMSHEDDKPYIQGEKKLDKSTPESRAKMQEQLKSMPVDKRNAMMELFKNSPKAQVDRTLEDGVELPYCGGILIIHTPGHTPGHICLYLKKSKILVAGDMLNPDDGELTGPNPQHTPEMDLAVESIKKFVQLDVEKVITYHGGLFTNNPNKKLEELAG